ncbi:MAG: esterase/lipase family protein [Gammaproteobacteria bacterium]
MLVVFVHGWSVTNTDTYGGLPAALQANAPPSLALEITDLFLARYVSFVDEITLDDIARAMQNAVNREILPRLGDGERFVCISHSTGAPAVRTWISMHFENQLSQCPVSHLVMLAPANHGSALAQLGKSRLSRLKFFAQGVEPGVGVLDWLELGSDQSWDLNQRWLSYDCAGAGLFLFVLTGQRIDREFYDNLNTYTAEPGSDGIVRVASTNMNYGLIRLMQLDGDGESNLILKTDDRTAKTAFAVIPGVSHSGDAMGIIKSIRADDDGSHPTLASILRCLEVNNTSDYHRVCREFAGITAKTQRDERIERTRTLFLIERRFETHRYCMLVFRLTDDRGNDLTDYDVIFTAGPAYNENHLPPGFFVDRQRNQRNRGKLTYYVDYDVMKKGLNKSELQGKFGIKIIARPSAGFAYYTVAEHQGTFADLKRYFEPNQTLMIEVRMRRRVGDGVFSFTQDLLPQDFRHTRRGNDIP